MPGYIAITEPTSASPSKNKPWPASSCWICDGLISRVYPVRSFSFCESSKRFRGFVSTIRAPEITWHLKKTRVQHKHNEHERGVRCLGSNVNYLVCISFNCIFPQAVVAARIYTTAYKVLDITTVKHFTKPQNIISRLDTHATTLQANSNLQNTHIHPLSVISSLPTTRRRKNNAAPVIGDDTLDAPHCDNLPAGVDHDGQIDCQIPINVGSPISVSNKLSPATHMTAKPMSSIVLSPGFAEHAHKLKHRSGDFIQIGI
ncbi:ATP-dependent helicase family protein [Striga asiatica]|uniref:ATP-dependent helicase family protein n=1 Tax=Striga asiatica TaxID=4170 RepID=A0A5A7QHA8_STRAF|nr:ATP-dependent helicase family protein [Striga asiatica]